MPLIWRDGRRVDGSPEELAEQLDRYADLANKEFGIFSNWRGIIGERFEEAAKEIRRLATHDGQ